MQILFEWHTEKKCIYAQTCTVDPILFENFLTEDGDLLRAKFQAFKFPETNFVLFKGIVNVCLDRCNGVRCSNGQVGFGKRKKRNLDDEPADQQRVYEVSMSTVVKVGDETTDFVVKDSKGNKKQTFFSEQAVISEIYHPDELAIARLSEAFGPSPAKFIDFQIENSAYMNKMSTVTFWTTLLAYFLVLWEDLHHQTKKYIYVLTILKQISLQNCGTIFSSP